MPQDEPAYLAGDGTYPLAPRGANRPERQQALLEIAGRKHQGGVSIDVDAELVREPENPYDAMAVRVEIAGKMVGYLSREHARAVVICLGAERMRARCAARIVGGWKREAALRPDGTVGRPASEGSFGVRLDVALPAREGRTS